MKSEQPSGYRPQVRNVGPKRISGSSQIEHETFDELQRLRRDINRNLIATHLPGAIILVLIVGFFWYALR